jgi:hypothetical protein
MDRALQALYDEERADVQQFQGAEAFIASQARRAVVDAWLNEGRIQTAENYFHAALIFQHGERLEHWAQAHLLAHTSADLGHPRARYLVAASYDRWLMRQGRPQKYGTNSTREGIWPYDPATTDAERAEWDVPPLQELLDRFQRMEQDVAAQGTPAALVTSVAVAGHLLDVSEWADSSTEIPANAVPVYEPATVSDRLLQLLPAEVSVWKFDALHCAKNAQGKVLCSWHRCRWKVRSATGDQNAQALAAALLGSPQWMSQEDAFWQRAGVATDATTCWLVGGHMARNGLQQLALSLVDMDC